MNMPIAEMSIFVHPCYMFVKCEHLVFCLSRLLYYNLAIYRNIDMDTDYFILVDNG